MLLRLRDVAIICAAYARPKHSYTEVLGLSIGWPLESHETLAPHNCMVLPG